MTAYSINTKAGVSICTPPDIHLMTPYVLLEQEEWFEPEVQFVSDFLQPGMKALDIGACFGVYALPMAKAVGPEGEVFAFEPCAQVRKYLDESAGQNNLKNVQVIPLALADRSGQAKLKTAKTPELNAISLNGDSGAAENVEAIMLDAWWAENGCPQIDVVKLDVNGSEAHVIQGGHAFFTQTSPVVVVSIKHNDQVNHQTIKALMGHGYGLYQYLPELKALVPFDHHAKPDAYLLNLLAIKSDVTSKLEEKGIIAQGASKTSDPQTGYWEHCLSAMPWTASFLRIWQQHAQNGAFQHYLEGLDLLCAAQRPEAVASTKFTQTYEATQRLMNIYQKSQHALGGPVALTLSRALHALGLREEAVQILEILVQSIQKSTEIDFNLPFLPPLPRFDQLPVQDSVEKWVAARCNESPIFLRFHSSYFSAAQDQKLLQILQKNPDRTLESQRRLALIGLREQRRITLKESSFLLKAGEENRNKWFWKNLPSSEIQQPVARPFPEVLNQSKANKYKEISTKELFYKAHNCSKQSNSKIQLDSVTLIAASSVDIEKHMLALYLSNLKISFNKSIFFTSEFVKPYILDIFPEIEIVNVRPINSLIDYSRFILKELNRYISTNYCLIVQSDGFVVNPDLWIDDFLKYDYVGAPWPKQVPLMSNGMISGMLDMTNSRVGNGGFSLRSKKLLQTSSMIDLKNLNTQSMSEDLIICHYLREWFENHEIKFAPVEHAAKFSFELPIEESATSWIDTFGFHGKLNTDAVLNLLSKRYSFHPDLNVLLYSLGPTHHMRKPFHISKNEIFCGPDLKDSLSNYMKIATLHIEAGRPDINSVLNRIPHDQKPQLLIVKADATKRSLPQNTQHINCPRILIVGNTQHLQSPIQTLLKYAQQEQFDLIVSDHKRHHLHFFRDAGLGPVAWMPAINYNPILSERNQKDISTVFVGQTGNFHPFRRRVLEKLSTRNINILIKQTNQQEAAELYARSIISLNISLNGDLNLRIFEIMAAGGFLLTDRLSPEAGMELLFTEGKEYEAWSTVDELIDKINYYTSHPEKAETIAKAGHKRLMEEHRPDIKVQELMEMVFSGKIPEKYRIDQDRPNLPTEPQMLNKRIERYEIVQEIHLNVAYPKVLILPEADLTLLADISDLPRLQMYYYQCEPVLRDRENQMQISEINFEHVELIIGRDQKQAKGILGRVRANHLILSVNSDRDEGIEGMEASSGCEGYNKRGKIADNKKRSNCNTVSATSCTTEPSGPPGRDCFPIRTKDNITVCTPKTLECMTAYVLLEQEGWFEPEIEVARRFARPGMNVVDIGAGFGVYALPLARVVSPHGRVFAFEPHPEAQKHINQSKEHNALTNLEPISQGLSDAAGQAILKHADTPELSKMLPDQPGDIELTTLDAWWQQAGTPDIDFIKLDVNGQETRVISGGQDCLAQTSPVILFCIGQGNRLNREAIQALQNLGYEIYRYLPGPQVLVPFEFQSEPDPSLLNLVAARLEKGTKLQEMDLLAPMPGSENPAVPEPGPGTWQIYLSKLPWTQGMQSTWQKHVHKPEHTAYLQALNWLCAVEMPQTTVVDKPALYHKAANILANIVTQDPSNGSAGLTLARALDGLGQRSKAVQAVSTLQRRREMRFNLPFLPPLEKFDHKPMHTQPQNWIMACCLESLIAIRDFSSYFSGQQDQEILKILHKNPEHSEECERRLALIGLRVENEVEIGEKSALLRDGEENRNGWFWGNALRPSERPDGNNAASCPNHYKMSEKAQPKQGITEANSIRKILSVVYSKERMDYSVDIVMPCYNSEKTIEKALDCIAAQTFQNFQIYIADNGSSDQTVELIKQHEISGKVKQIIVNPLNIGPIRSTWNILKFGNAPLTLHCSSNDELQPDFLQELIELYKSDPSLSIAYALPDIYQDGRLVQKMVPSQFFQTLGMDAIQACLTVVARYTVSAPLWGLFNKHVLRLMNPNSFYRGSDHVLVAEASLYGSINFVTKNLMKRNINNGRTLTTLAYNESDLFLERSRNEAQTILGWHSFPYISMVFAHHEMIRKALLPISAKDELLKQTTYILERRFRSQIWTEINMVKRRTMNDLSSIIERRYLFDILNFIKFMSTYLK